MKRSPFEKVVQNNTAYGQQPVVYITNHTVACDVLNLFRTEYPMRTFNLTH